MPQGAPDFNPRPPRGGRRRQFVQCVNDVQFQSPPSARRATAAALHDAEQLQISIHALREEGDGSSGMMTSLTIYFNPRPPRGGRPIPMPSMETPGNFNPRPPRGGRPYRAAETMPSTKFQSTPSARRATRSATIWPSVRPNFNPRPPRGGRPRYPGVMRKFHYFNPRPPRGGRPGFLPWTTKPNYFNPRPPRGGRPLRRSPPRPRRAISIHALREEGDAIYQSLRQNQLISIHALREEGDTGALKL